MRSIRQAAGNQLIAETREMLAGRDDWCYASN